MESPNQDHLSHREPRATLTKVLFVYFVYFVVDLSVGESTPGWHCRLLSGGIIRRVHPRGADQD